MLRYIVCLGLLAVSFVVSLPTCKISYWIGPKNVTCTAAPNGTYPSLVYNGSCTLSPDDPRRTSYRLSVDMKTKTVQNFTVFRDQTCSAVDELMLIKTPLQLNTCGPLFYVTAPTISVQVGSVFFSCRT